MPAASGEARTPPTATTSSASAKLPDSSTKRCQFATILPNLKLGAIRRAEDENHTTTVAFNRQFEQISRKAFTGAGPLSASSPSCALVHSRSAAESLECGPTQSGATRPVAKVPQW